MNVKRKRGKGRSKKRWLDTIESLQRVAGICKGNAEDRDKWKSRTSLHNGGRPKLLERRQGRRRRRRNSNKIFYSKA